MNTVVTEAPLISPVKLAIYTMWLRELVRFWRQKSRLFGAMATPLVFWVVLGAGFGSSFKPGGALEGTSYLQFFFPGTILLTVLFTAIYSTISVIEDRKEGFLQAVLVAPVSRSGVVLGKMLGATTLAVGQGALMLLAGPLVGIPIGPVGFLLGVIVLAVIAFALAGLGFLLAWSMDSTSGFHALMNLLLMPMWLLSGAVFPLADADLLVRVAMIVNPLTYCMSLFRIVTSGSTAPASGLPIWLCVLFTLVFAGIMMASAISISTSRKSLQK